MFVQLGRFGDIINILPILQEEERLGFRPTLMVAKDYASIMDGVPYADVLVYEGEFKYLLPAIRQAERYAYERDMEVIITQVYGLGYKWDRKTDSFATDAWWKAAYYADWNKLPLTFKRDKDREKRLARALPERPILLATAGTSSPFPHAERLTTALKRAYPGRVVVLDNIRAERIYDVLGLYDRAAVLVTIDTMHAHLCMASKVPTVCLVVQRPTTWHGAPERPNHVLRVKYPEYLLREKELLDTVAQYAGEPAAEKVAASKSRLLHVYASYSATGDTCRRHDFARDTWAGFKDHPFEEDNGFRTASDVLAYPRPLPFMRDLLFYGAGEANPSDIIVVTNTDTCFAPGLAAAIRKHVRKHGAAYAHRHDFPRLTIPLEADEVKRGKWYPGSDLFAFTPQWWGTHAGDLPDMIVGAEFVDCVLRQFIKKHGGVELVHAIYHERHASAWERPGVREVDAANCWNKVLARKWFAENGTTDRDPWDAPLPDARKFAV